jgi:hypothetical protein
MLYRLYLLLVLVLPMTLLSTTVFTQSDVQLGVSAYAKAPVTNNPSLGTGAALETWLRFPSGDRAVELAFGYQQLGGYQHGYKSTFSSNSIWSSNFVSERVELYRLNYLYAQLRHKWTWSRWGGSIGGRISRWVGARGLRMVSQESHSKVYHTISPPEFTAYHLLWGRDSGSGRRQSKQTRGQFQELMTGYDFGINLMLHYKLLEGLSLQAGYYQGFNNQWSDNFPADNLLLIQIFSFGLSARVF